jgi:hypothetical protein
MGPGERGGHPIFPAAFPYSDSKPRAPHFLMHRLTTFETILCLKSSTKDCPE